MPTGYTADIKDGISFEKFVWSCARGMGALVMMRDEPTGAPIPQRFEPSDYNARQVAQLRGDIARLEAMTIEQVQAEAESAYISAVESRRLRIREKLELHNKYSEMLAKVVQWNAPTPDHEGLKNFMASQLRESMDFDCSTVYDEAPERQEAAAWHNAQITEARRMLAYHEKAHAEEVQRTEARNDWLTALRDSVPPSHDM
jgi:hypothetical protein